MFPAASFAVHVTVLVPIGNVEADGGRHENDVTPTASSAPASYETDAPSGAVAFVVMPPGTVTTGAVVSTTVTSNGAEPRLPCASTTKQSTCVVPTGNGPGEAGEHVAARAPSTASAAVTRPNGTAVSGPVASTVRSEGTFTTGGLVSRTVTWNVAVARLPEVSDAVQVTVVVPIANGPGDAGSQTTVRAPSIRSVAVGGVNGTGVVVPAASAVRSNGTSENVGGRKSAPGEPTSTWMRSPGAANAPLTPTALSVEIAGAGCAVLVRSRRPRPSCRTSGRATPRSTCRSSRP